MITIVPPSVIVPEESDWPRRNTVPGWVRGILVMMAIVLVGVFTIAAMLNPYRGGRVWYEQTHTQLGLPGCTFKLVTNVPCPSCGMTSSFALLIRGDIWNSLQANAVGTALGLFCLLFIPWSIASALVGRLIGISNVERTMVRLVAGFVILLVVRWGMVIAMTLWS